MPGLTSKDFVVLDDGKEQSPLEVEQTTDTPVAAVIVMQTGGSAYRFFPLYRIITRLVQIAPVQRVALVTFDSKPREIWSFPVHLDGINRAMDNPQRGDGGASILDAVKEATNLLKDEPRTMRRLIILLSQSEDLGSATPPPQLLERLGQLNAPIYSFSFKTDAPGAGKAAERSCLESGGTFLQEGTINSPSIMRIQQRLCHDTAAELAALSGGEHVLMRTQDDVDRSADLLSEALVNAYTLSFQPNTPSSGFHSLQVRAGTKATQLVVTSRAFYWLP